jgi:hypothetical protein
MAHSAWQNLALWPIAHNIFLRCEILHYGLQEQKLSQVSTLWLHSMLWTIAHNQIHCSGPQRVTKFAALTHSS